MLYAGVLTRSQEFHRLNPGVFECHQDCNILLFSLIMLSSDQHNANVKNPMTLEQWVRNHKGVRLSGGDFPVGLLEELYTSVCVYPLTMVPAVSFHGDVLVEQGRRLVFRSFQRVRCVVGNGTLNLAGKLVRLSGHEYQSYAKCSQKSWQGFWPLEVQTTACHRGRSPTNKVQPRGGSRPAVGTETKDVSKQTVITIHCEQKRERDRLAAVINWNAMHPYLHPFAKLFSG